MQPSPISETFSALVPSVRVFIRGQMMAATAAMQGQNCTTYSALRCKIEALKTHLDELWNTPPRHASAPRSLSGLGQSRGVA